jgi:hypothetical protein
MLLIPLPKIEGIYVDCSRNKKVLLLWIVAYLGTLEEAILAASTSLLRPRHIYKQLYQMQ